MSIHVPKYTTAFLFIVPLKIAGIMRTACLRRGARLCRSYKQTRGAHFHPVMVYFVFMKSSLENTEELNHRGRAERDIFLL
jgi:hypothetical protein